MRTRNVYNFRLGNHFHRRKLRICLLPGVLRVLDDRQIVSSDIALYIRVFFFRVTPRRFRPYETQNAETPK